MSEDNYSLIHPSKDYGKGNMVNSPFYGFPTQLGDIFNTDVFSQMGMLYRSWHLKVTSSTMGRREQSLKISIRYNSAQSIFILIINGKVRLKYLIADTITSDKPVLACKFSIFDNEFSIFAVKNKNLVKVEFFLYMNVPENPSTQTHNITTTSTSSSLANQYQALKIYENYRVPHIKETANISLDEPKPKNIIISDVRIVSPSIDSTKSVAYFCIESEMTHSKQKIAVEKRFSDFTILDSILRSLTSKHLLDTLPKLPGKVYNPFFNQLDKKFLLDRKKLLEKYLFDLLNNEKLCYLTEFYCFLGIDPINGLPLNNFESVETLTN